MIVLTGGAGFIGSCLLKALNARGIYDILVVDHLDQSEKWRNLLGKRFDSYIDKRDFVENLENYSSLFGSIDCIFHLGACSSTVETDSHYMLSNNYQYTKTLAEFALKHSIRFIYASSAATYGAGEQGYSDATDKIFSLRPLNVYGYSKQLFDEWVVSKGLDKKFAGLKFFNVFGPNEFHKGDMRSLIHKSVGQIKETGKLQLFKSYRSGIADGDQQRDFVYVFDVVDMILHFFDNPTLTGIFNVGSGTATSWNILAEAIFRSLDRHINLEYIDMPDSIRDKYQYFTLAETNKLKLAGYEKRQWPIEDAVTDYVRGYILKGNYF